MKELRLAEARTPRGPDGWQKWVYGGAKRPEPRASSRKRHVSGLPEGHPIFEAIRNGFTFAAVITLSFTLVFRSSNFIPSYLALPHPSFIIK